MIREHSCCRNLAMPFPIIHEQPLTLPHYFEISDIDFSLVSFPKSRALELCSNSSLVLWPDRWDDSYGCPFEDFRNPYAIFGYSPVSIRNPLCEMVVNFNGETHFSCKNRITLVISSRDKVTSTYPYKQPLTDPLLRHLLHVIRIPSANSYWHIIFFINTKFRGRKLYIWTSLEHHSDSLTYTTWLSAYLKKLITRLQTIFVGLSKSIQV